MRIGIDLGGTKIEGLALDHAGAEVARKRVATPQGDYEGTVAAIVALVGFLEQAAGARCTVGVGLPGALSLRTGLAKNANSTCLNGRPFALDLEAALGRPVRCANDANCLAVSEATDGAGAGASVVFAVILGTGCGAGIALGGRVHDGPNRVAGEWGHNPLPWAQGDETPGPACYCGRRGCIETWLSGPGLEADHLRASGQRASAAEIVARASAGDDAALAALDRHQDRLARALAHAVNLLDPDVIVLAGGVSKIDRLYDGLAARVRARVFGGEFETPIRPARHGDASGVRGAAWLWPAP